MRISPYIVAILTVLLSYTAAQGQITKSLGVLYFNSVPNRDPANVSKESEISYNIAEKQIYIWDRDVNGWRKYKTGIYRGSDTIPAGTVSTMAGSWIVNNKGLYTIGLGNASGYRVEVNPYNVVMGYMPSSPLKGKVTADASGVTIDGGPASTISVTNSGILIGSAYNMTISDPGNNGGIKYDDDYSSHYTARSLVDKAYVDSHGSLTLYQIDYITPLPSQPIPSGTPLIKKYDLNNNNDLYFSSGSAWIEAGKLVGIQNIDSIAIMPNAIRSTQIKNSAVTMSKIAQSGAAAGQVIKWNGTAWAPGTDLTGGGGASIDSVVLSIQSNKLGVKVNTTPSNLLQLTGSMISGNISGNAANVTGVVGVANGGTGLSAIGTANQLIRVNSGATALEFFTPSYLTSNQTVTLSGDISGSGTTAITTSIASGAVTFAKIQNIASGVLLGRSTAGTGSVESLTLGSGLSLSGGVLSATGSGTVTSVSVTTANGVSGVVSNPTTTPAITLTLGAITPSTVNGLTFTALSTGFTIAGGSTSKTLTIPLDATVSGTNTGDQTITLSGGDVATGAMTNGTYSATINNNAVTVAKMQQIATSSFLGRTTSGTGNVEILTTTQATSLLNTFVASGSSHAKGLVPDPGASAGTTKFLREDATWVDPFAGSQVAFIESSTATSVILTANTGVVKDVDGNNVIFTLPSDLGRLKVYKNGVKLTMSGTGTTRDYSINTGTSTITFTTALTTADRIEINK